MHKSLSIGYWIGSIERVLQIIDIFETKKQYFLGCKLLIWNWFFYWNFLGANYWSVYWFFLGELLIFLGSLFPPNFPQKTIYTCWSFGSNSVSKSEKTPVLARPSLEKACPWKRLFLGKGLSLEKLWGSALEKAAWLEGEEPEIIQNPMWILAFSTKLLLPMRTWWQTWAPMSTCPGQMHHAQLGWSGAFLCGGHS